jgi:hypothetical protein
MRGICWGCYAATGGERAVYSVVWVPSESQEDARRMCRIGSVALARKLLIALWRYLETGEIPAGAHLKAA